MKYKKNTFIMKFFFVILNIKLTALQTIVPLLATLKVRLYHLMYKKKMDSVLVFITILYK